MINCFILPGHNSRPVDVSFRGCVLRAKMTLFLSLRELSASGKNRVWRELLNHFVRLLHGDPTDMRESTSVFQIRTINWSKLDK